MINGTKSADIKVITNNLRVKQISQAHDGHLSNYRLKLERKARSSHKDITAIETR